MKSNNTIRIKIGRDNLSLTIFIPWDCTKNCPFCTTKSDYSKGLSDIDSIIELAKNTLKKIPQIRDIVISGGEPLDNLKSLSKLIRALESYNKNIYINTSFPIILEEDKKIFENILSKIKGLNVSRHKEHDYSNFLPLSLIKSLISDKCPVRINIILNKHINLFDRSESTDMLGYIKSIMEYDYFDIQLRANYLKTDVYTCIGYEFGLRDTRDDTTIYLATLGQITSTKCSVCSTNYVTYNNRGNTISFHKGLRKTKLHDSTYDFYEVNDIIITPQGFLKLDWEDNPISLDQIHIIQDIKRIKVRTATNTCGPTIKRC